MTCSTFDDLVSTYYAGVLAYCPEWQEAAPADYVQRMNDIRATIHQHKRDCPACRSAANMRRAYPVIRSTPRRVKAAPKPADTPRKHAEPKPGRRGRPMPPLDEVVNVVRELAGDCPPSMNEIMRRTGRGHSSTTRMLRAAQAQGLLERRRGRWYPAQEPTA